MGCTQISVNGILTVPEHKPDIEDLLRISTTARIDKTITTRKKIFFCGHVDICVEYVACACDCTQPIHFLHTEIPFNGLILHRFARECFNTFLKAEIRFCESEVISCREISNMLILKLSKIKFRRIPKHPDSHCFKPFHGMCKSANSHCVPGHCECKPPVHKPDCKPHDPCECKPPICKPDCKPHNPCECKPPVQNHDCKPHDSCECQPPAYTYDYVSYHSAGCKPHGREPVPSNDCHIPTSIQPYKRIANSRGVAFRAHCEE